MKKKSKFLDKNSLDALQNTGRNPLQILQCGGGGGGGGGRGRGGQCNNTLIDRL